MSNDAVDERSMILERIAQFRSEDADVPPIWQAKRELATSVRALLDCICATDAGEPELRRAATEIRGMAERFARGPVVTDPLGIAEMALSGMETFHDRSPLVGRSNPIAPPRDIVKCCGSPEL